CRRGQQPGFLVGWLWFLGTLVPVIGIIATGAQAYADRYTYLPHVGLLLMLVVAADAALRWIDVPLAFRRLLAVFVGMACCGLTRLQVEYWQNSETLWRHTLAVTQHNPTALVNLGTALTRQSRHREAAQYFAQAVELLPTNAAAQFNLG